MHPSIQPPAKTDNKGNSTMMPYATTVPPNEQILTRTVAVKGGLRKLKPRCYIYTHRQLPPDYGKMVTAFNTRRRQPGILDRIQTCESREAAHLLWHEFLDGANAVSQKTINKANRLLSTLDFPLP